MAFCKYSTEFIANSKTEIDNIFINDYLPFSSPQFSMVYIYGLYLCQSDSFDNSLENFAKTLNMSQEDVVGAFEYWQEQGLVQILSTNPIQIVYIPLKNVLTSNKLYKPDKYTTFNSQANEIFKGKRSISKHEYQEYYDFLERYHVEQEALLMIMKYCVESKKSAVGYNYILTVAKNWASEGITSTLQVEEKLKTMEEKNEDMSEIFKALSIKRLPTIEERAFLDKWQNDLGFQLDVVLYICKKLKKKSKFSFERVDALLTKYFEMKLCSVSEIKEFENEKQKLFDLAKEINKTIGVYYENLETVVENYILKWINMGFDNSFLLSVAEYCFKTSIRTLEGMDKTLLKFFKLGILTTNAFNQYIDQILYDDDKIKNILSTLSLNRNVNNFDRNLYKNWKENWGYNDEIIDYALTLAKGKQSPLKYLSKVLADWHEKGIKTLQEAKEFTKTNFIEDKSTQLKSNFTGRSYSKNELNALFQSIEEIDV